MAWYCTKKAKKLLKMDRKKIIVLDTETTGLSRVKDEILQITILDGNGRELFNSYIKPVRRKSWKSAEKVHHITPEMVRSAPIFSDVQTEIQKILDQANVIIGYNVGFDISFLEHTGVVVTAKRFDLMYEFATFRSKVEGTSYRRYKLQECADYYNYPYIAHNSESDTEATLYCFNQLIDDSRFVTNELNQGEPDEVKKKSLSIRIPVLPKMRLSMILGGMMCVFGGELLCYALEKTWILSFSQYLDLLTHCVGSITEVEWIHASVILIPTGLILCAVGLIKWLIRLPKRMVSRIRRLWSNVRSFFD